MAAKSLGRDPTRHPSPCAPKCPPPDVVSTGSTGSEGVGAACSPARGGKRGRGGCFERAWGDYLNPLFLGCLSSALRVATVIAAVAAAVAVAAVAAAVAAAAALAPLRKCESGDVSGEPGRKVQSSGGQWAGAVRVGALC